MKRLRSFPGRGNALWLALLLALLVTWTASAAGGTTTYLPYISKAPTPTPTSTPTATPTPTPPVPADNSVSYYVQTTSSQDAYNKGCALGQGDLNLPGAQDRLVILDFGQPWYENGQYGTIIFRVPPATEFIFAGMNTVKEVAKNFALGYWQCTGNDKDSLLTLGIGTSNYLRADMTYWSNANQHGRLWAQVVLDVNQWLTDQNYAAQVHAVGANDMELFWATPSLTRAWVDGFAAVADKLAIYYNYGACEGCPQSYYSEIGSWTGGVNYSWTIQDVWYISWGVVPGWVVPEIYLSNEANARQWQTLSEYAAVQKGARIDFSGVMTQYGACQQRGGCINEDTGVDTMNTPLEGWTQLWQYTYNKAITRQSTLRWMTDCQPKIEMSPMVTK